MQSHLIICYEILLSQPNAINLLCKKWSLTATDVMNTYRNLQHGATRLDLSKSLNNFKVKLSAEPMALEESLHPWVKMDQAVRPLPPMQLSILKA